MWFLWDAEAGVLKLTHTNQRHNFRNLKANPHVALSITDPDDQYRYLQVRGEIEKMEDDPTGAFYQTLQQRYRGYTAEVKDQSVGQVDAGTASSRPIHAAPSTWLAAASPSWPSRPRTPKRSPASATRSNASMSRVGPARWPACRASRCCRRRCA